MKSQFQYIDTNSPTDLQYNNIQMGNNNTKQDRLIPQRGYRIIEVKPHIANQLNLLTDYILAPDPKMIDLSRDCIRMEVYSILSEEVRTVELPIVNRELGLKIREDDISNCIMRITRIFPGSPFAKYGIHAGEFLVGVMEGTYADLKAFASLVSSLSSALPKHSITLGICGEEGKTRIVRIPIAELREWQGKGKGLLGCELAEGWIHKWKPGKEQKDRPTPKPEPVVEQSRPAEPVKIPQMRSLEQNSGTSSEDSVDRKCNALLSQHENNESVEVKFRGILKNEELIDASSICKCRQKSLTCQKCFIEKDDNYYFYNHKHKRIVDIPIKMMMIASEQ